MPSVIAELCDILSRHLSDQDIGPDDDFYAMGGDSLIALRVVADARERGIAITLRDILYYPTARELGAHLRGEPGAAGESTSDGRLTPADLALVPPGVAEVLPASALQLAMVYLCESSGDPELYHSSISWEVAESFDEPAFRAALGELCGRHPALRTSLDLGSYSVATQLVWSRVEPPLEITEAPERGAVKLPLDWGAAPLFRCGVVAAPSGFRVTLVMHHAIVDGWSYGRLIVDLLALYRAAVHGEDAGLPALPGGIQRTFIEAELERSGSAEAAEYWQHQADVPALLFDRGRFSGAADARESVGFDLPQELVEALREAARRVRVPLKSLALAAHWWALGALAGRFRDVVTGVVVNTRPQVTGADLVVGLYLNTVPLRSPVLAGTWAELAAAALAAERDGSAHHAYPLAHIENRLGRPAFDVTFNFTHFHVYADLNRLAGLPVRSWRVRGKPSFPFRIDFEVAGMESGSRVVVAFDPDLLPLADARRYAWLYEQALSAAAAEPFAPASVALTGSPA
jgi:aryl carrier-like protein